MIVDGVRSGSAEVLVKFRSLLEDADWMFAVVRDLPPGATAPAVRSTSFTSHRLWKFQKRRRREIVAEDLSRWEIGEVTSRIGQLFYGQYQRTSEVCFLLEAYVSCEAIMHSRSRYKESTIMATNFRECMQMSQEVARFLKLDASFS